MESGIEPNVDLDSLDERIKIREMVLKGQIQEAIALINNLHPELLDTNRYLYFHLQVNIWPYMDMLGARDMSKVKTTPSIKRCFKCVSHLEFI